MKKICSILVVTFLAISVSAQMRVWQNGEYQMYPLSQVDSITFAGPEAYTVTLTAPDCGGYKPAVKGDFNGWAAAEPMTKNADGTYSYTFNDIEGHYFRFCAQNDTAGTNPLEVYDSHSGSWQENPAIMLTSAQKNITVDYTYGRYALCPEEVVSPVKGSQVWPVILDGVTAATCAHKIVSDFRVDDTVNFLYIWEGTYTGGGGGGNNSYGQEGYLSLLVGGKGWSGLGYCLTDKGNVWQDAEALRAAIVAEPDKYFLHIAIKSTDANNHCFYFLGSQDTKFTLGSAVFDGGPVYSDFERDGEWHEFDIPLAPYAAALASTTCTAGVNVSVALSGGTQGAQLNLDALYFYKQ